MPPAVGDSRAHCLVSTEALHEGIGVISSQPGRGDVGSARRRNREALEAFSPDSEAMGFLLQIAMSCPCALSRQVVGAGAGCRCWRWCCELAVHVVGTGCWRRCWCWVPSAGAGAVSWLCTWWRQVACWCWVLGAGAGAGAMSWLCAWWRQVAGAGAGAGRRWCWVPGGRW